MAGHHRTPVKPGARFGMLVVRKELRKNDHSQVLWEVKCDCGRSGYAWGYNLVKGKKVNCGCVRAGLAGKQARPISAPPDDRQDAQKYSNL
jgi:hypothetical protein